MSNKIELTDNLIRITYGGDQTVETIANLERDVVALADKLKSDGKPVLYVVDIDHIGKLTSSARMRAVKFVKEAEYDKIATFGGSTFMQSMNNLLIRGLQKSHKLGYFKTEAEALQWLRK